MQRGEGVRGGGGSKKCSAVGAVRAGGTLRRKMDSIFHEHRARQTWIIEGGEPGESGEGGRAESGRESGFRWESNTADDGRPTSQTVGGREGSKAKKIASFCLLLL